MKDAKIDQLIINSPYREPDSFWRYSNESAVFEKVNGRRPSGFLTAKSEKDEGRFIEIDLVNRIRPRVKAWREADYLGITSTTRMLIEHWHDENARHFPFFWCQLDAIETLIFLTEAPEILKFGLAIPNDGGNFRRLCTKLCTGGGKTIVMAMLIAWQICCKVNYPSDKRFTKNILVITPNLTVKQRLEVLKNSCEENYYSQFSIVPPELQDRLTQGKIIIHNWQALLYETEDDIAKRKSIDKRPPKSDNAYSRELVGDMKNILVINDEAHHAYRITANDKPKKSSKKEKLSKEKKKEIKESQREATIWIEGLDRIDRARRITMCYDFSATPFVPGINVNDEEGLFKWIVSDFSLNDGIESGLVKTPRFVVRDNTAPDSATYRTKLSHIYADSEVKDDLTRNNAQENESLPDLVRNAYMLLGHDWRILFDEWRAAGKIVPPVMITVANNTSTAARIAYAFENHKIDTPGLDEGILRIDSKILDDVKNTEAKILREKADTVGKEGCSGEQVRNVISVSMLSEGWDARNVTHIMGLRAFTSQLLCEQVIGRGLRRTSYDPPKNPDGLFSPEYVNVFGIPFEFLPHEDIHERMQPDTKTTMIKVLPEREEYRISWPNVTRLEYVTRQKLSLDFREVPELLLDAENVSISAELAPVLDGRTDLTKCSDIDLEKLYRRKRLQNINFDAASKIYDRTFTQWQKEGVKLALLGQVIKLTEEYLRYGNIKILPELFAYTPIRRKIMIAMNMERIINHIWKFIVSESSEEIIPVLDQMKKEGSTGDMLSWYTCRNSKLTCKSHINRCVFDSTWEDSAGYYLDKNPNVKAWAKNDHLGFNVSYLLETSVRRYYPDFLVKLINDKTLILEVKGREDSQDRVKREALSEFVRAVNGIKIYGEWCCDVAYSPAEIDGIIDKYLS